MFKTRITELFGIKYPIICGAMAYVSTPELVAAVSNAGGLGILVTATIPSKAEFREQVKKTKSLTDKPFGVNINLFPTIRELDNKGLIDITIKEGVKIVETSGYLVPDEYMALFKAGNIKVYHKCTNLKHAKAAERIGVDAVGIVGYEGGSAIGMNDLCNFIFIPRAVETLNIPVIQVGGVSNARGFVAALALGAEGVVMGTRFVATKECAVHPKIKEWIVDAEETDTMVVDRAIRLTHRVMRTPVAERVLGMEQNGATIEELIPLIGGAALKKAIVEGDVNLSTITIGQVSGLIHEVLSVKDVIDNIVSGAKEIGKRLDGILSLAE